MRGVHTIGLAVGEGTGREIAEVFERVVELFGQLYSADVRIERSPRVYQSYHSILPEQSAERISRMTGEDAAHYAAFCRRLAGMGVRAVFRTAMNAQALYMVREQLQSVKVERLTSRRVDLLLVRDQAQGFYSGNNKHDYADGVVERTCRFSKQLTGKILDFAVGQARRQWGPEGIDRLLMAYKFHLFDGLFSAWASEWSGQYGIPIELCQPDTTNRNILHSGLEGRILIVGANEWADIMHVVLLDLLGLERQESRFTRNVYLDPALDGLVEYQTVHGSADDLADKGLVNPFAAMRAAAAIMEQHAGCEGAQAAMEEALRCGLERGLVTPDLGGRCSTGEVVASVLGAIHSPDIFTQTHR